MKNLANFIIFTYTLVIKAVQITNDDEPNHNNNNDSNDKNSNHVDTSSKKRCRSSKNRYDYSGEIF